MLQTFTSWLTGMPAEFSDPKFPSYGEGREGEGPTGLHIVCLSPMACSVPAGATAPVGDLICDWL
jgi:hypothetical protein